MKIKYLRLSKEEKAKVKEDFFKTNQVFKKKINIVKICGYLLILYGIFLMAHGYFNNLEYFDIIYGAIVFIFGIIMNITAKTTVIKKLNYFVIKK